MGPETFTGAIRRRVRDLDLSADALAQRLGVSRQRARQLLLQDNLTVATAIRVCDAIGLRMVLVEAGNQEGADQ